MNRAAADTDSGHCADLHFSSIVALYLYRAGHLLVRVEKEEGREKCRRRVTEARILRECAKESAALG